MQPNDVETILNDFVNSALLNKCTNQNSFRIILQYIYSY